MAQPSGVHHGESGPLIPITSNPVPFQQQGTVDWVDLSKHTVNFSLDILARISANQVQPYTVGIGRILSANFELSPLGWQNVLGAVENLKAVGSLGDVFWFGFGIRSLPREAAMTKEGSVCLALCAALSEGYHENTAAEILSEMLRLNKPPQALSPSLSEWRALLQAFQGVFANTTFPLKVDQLSKIIGERSSIGYSHSQDALICRHTNLKALAETLWAIGRASRNDLASIKIVGEADLAWLTAVSDWLLGLPVNLSNSEDATIFANCRSGEERVQLIYQKSAEGGGRPIENLKTYRLDTTKQLIHLSDMTRESVHAMNGGRVAWKNCLSSVFPSAFQKLCRVMSSFGTLIGSLARILTAIHQGLYDSASKGSSHWRYTYCSRMPYGRNYIQSLLSYFPELAKAEVWMDEAMNANLKDAECQYETKLAMLQSVCSVTCSICGDVKESNQPKNADEDTFEGSCLYVLVKTIIEHGQHLAMITVHENLLPLTRGFQIAYMHQANAHKIFPLKNDDENSSTKPYSIRWGSDSAVVDTAFLLFAGRVFDSSREQSARSRLGVCVFTDSLLELSDEHESTACFHVISGRIEHQGRSYTLIEDRQDVEKGPKPVFLNKRKGTTQKPTTEVSQDAWRLYTDVSLLVTDHLELGALLAAYEVTGNGAKPMLIGPSRFQKRLSEVPRPFCMQQYCASVDIQTKKMVDDTYRQVSSLGMNLEIFCGKPIARCVALATSHCLDTCCCFIGFDACLACSIKFAARCDPGSGLILLHDSYIDHISKTQTQCQIEPSSH